MPIAWATSSCVQHDARCLGCRRSMEMTTAFPTICLSDLFPFTAVSPSATTPLQFTSHLCWRYVLSPYHSSARSIYIVPFTFSLLAKAFIYSVFATKYPLTISPHLRRTACVLDDAESIHLVHFTCSSWQGFCYIFSVRFVSL